MAGNSLGCFLIFFIPFFFLTSLELTHRCPHRAVDVETLPGGETAFFKHLSGMAFDLEEAQVDVLPFQGGMQFPQGFDGLPVYLDHGLGINQEYFDRGIGRVNGCLNPGGEIRHIKKSRGAPNR